MEGKDRIPRAQVLTEADMKALSELIRESHHCQFTSEEVQFVRDFLISYREARSFILKAVLSGVFLVVSAVAILSFRAKIWGK